MTRRSALSLVGIVSLATMSCGYHVGAKADLVPKNIRTIDILPFNTLTTRYTLTDQLPREIGREFSARTKFVIVNNPTDADAILNGTITSAFASPTIYDPASGKATSVQVVLILSVKLIDQRSGKIIWSRANWAVREDYELAVDPHQFFNESGPALDRLSKDVARDLVSSVVENF